MPEQVNPNSVALDIFLDETIQEKLPKGWKYTKFRDHVKRLANNPCYLKPILYKH